MIEGKSHFDPIDAHLPLHEHGPRVVEQDMKVCIFALERVRQSPDFLLRRQIRQQRVHVFITASGANFLDNLRSLCSIAPHDHDRCAHPGECLGCAFPNPICSACDQAYFPLHCDHNASLKHSDEFLVLFKLWRDYVDISNSAVWSLSPFHLWEGDKRNRFFQAPSAAAIVSTWAMDSFKSS